MNSMLEPAQNATYLIAFSLAAFSLTGCDSAPQLASSMQASANSQEKLDDLLWGKYTPTSTDLEVRTRVIGKWNWADPEVWIEYRADGTFEGVLNSYIAPSIHKGLDYSGTWEIRDGKLRIEHKGNADNSRLVSLWNIAFRDNALGHQMVLNNTSVEMLRIYTRDDAQ